ncbi:hypothetical protein BACPU_15260 [Bacillus pumilus]|nr:hypothetical protein BACPU_15260 [Bacillus pumilus]
MRNMMYMCMLLLLVTGAALYLGGCSQHKSATEDQKIRFTIEDKDLGQTTVLNYAAMNAVSAIGDRLFFSVDDQSLSMKANKVVEFNRKTQKSKTLFTTTFERSSIQEVKANKDWVVWIDSDEFGGQMNYYAMNIKTQKIELFKQMDDSELLSDTLELTGDRVVWVTHHEKKGETHIFMRDLSNKQTKKLFKLKSMANSHLSVYQDKLLFFDEKNGKMQAYIYNFTTEDLKEIMLNQTLIGNQYLINDHQFVYEKSFTDSEGAVHKSQLFFYDVNTKQTKPLSKKDMDGSGLVVIDDQKRMFVHTEISGEESYFTFKEVNGSIKEFGPLKVGSHVHLTFDHGLYLLHSENAPRTNQKLVITSKLP